ncbi:MAG: energy transducer TonB [Sphingobacteriales bacterium 50-39]|nr:TonB family protein [Sphingobacteriales bacterium]OJW58361.1 MAG: energy transducer TonB [Sphingobacteriales bacterium 50-39]
MEIKNIMDADILDIIFEGRNKDYGAYDLRKSYNRRLIKSLMCMALVLVLLFIGYFLSGMTPHAEKKALYVTDTDLSQLQQEKKEIPPIVIPPPKTQQVEIKQFTPPKLVKEDVPQDEKPPEQTELEDTKIGSVNQAGLKDDGIVAPPVSDAGRGVVEAPKKEEDDADKIFTKVEIESSYPGGDGAWARFLNKNLHYPDEALNNNIEGTVMVQFVVDQQGNVSDVQAVSGPSEGGLREEAIRVIKKSGKWTAAIQNGHPVKSYKRQPVGFKTGE